MKVRGMVTLVFRDVGTGEITKTITQENVVTDWFYEKMSLDGNATSFNNERFGEFVFLSSYDPGFSDPTRFIIPNIVGHGTIVGGVTTPRITLATDTMNPFGEHEQRFLPPSSTITIRIIGVTDTPATTYDAVYAQAYVKLASPCTQGTLETLDVFYRIIFPYDYYIEPSPVDRDTTKISAAQANILVNRHILTPSPEEWIDREVSTKFNGNINYSTLPFNYVIGGTTVPDGGGFLTTADADQSYADLNKKEVSISVPITNPIGIIVGHIAMGDNVAGGLAPWIRNVSNLGEGVIQSIFGHDASSIIPFFDNTNQNSGDGKIILDGSSWTNPNWPKMYKLDITSTGGDGVGTYKFQVREHFGFYNNTFNNVIRQLPSLNYQNAEIHENFMFTNQDTTPNSLKQDRPTFLNYDVNNTHHRVLAIRKDSVYALELQTETGNIINSTNYAAFTPTNTTQVTYESGGTMFVGCRDTGIYKVTDPFGSPAVSKIDNTTTGLTGLATSNCYGVVVGNGRLWSVWDGGLFYSTDSGVSWTQSNFTNGTITADWTLVKYLQADPTHADHRLALIYHSGGTTYRDLSIMWWSETGSPPGTDVQGPHFISMYNPAVSLDSSIIRNTFYRFDEPWTYFIHFKPSPTQSKWAAPIKNTTRTTPAISLYPAFFTFGTLTITQPVVTLLARMFALFIDWELDISNNDNVTFLGINSDPSDVRFSLMTEAGVITSNQIQTGTAAQKGDDDALVDGPICYLGRGIYIFWTTGTTKSYYIVSSGQHDSPTGGALEHIIYDSYGWNGAAWELDHVGSKTIHTAAEALHDGITIALATGSPSGSFTSTDYYTFGVLQGVWLDGSTSIDHTMGLYYKKIKLGVTELESATLPASTKVPEIFEYINSFTWQDTSGVSTSTSSLRLSGSHSGFEEGGRSVEKTLVGGITNKAPTDRLHCSFAFRIDSLLDSTAEIIVAGLSPVSVIGNAISDTSIHYGFKLTCLTTGDGNLTQVDIIEQGAIAATNVGLFDGGTASSYYFIIEILNDGTVEYFVDLFSDDTSLDPLQTFPNTKNNVHTSAGSPSVPLVEYYIDAAFEGIVFTGIHVVNNTQPLHTVMGGIKTRIAADYYLDMGDSAASPQDGRYLSNFFAVDYTQNIEVLIAGVPAVQLTPNDTITTLLAGQISVFSEGFIRYSAMDTGKAVSATYNVLTTD